MYVLFPSPAALVGTSYSRLDQSKGPSPPGPKRSCRRKRNSSSWKVTMKSSLEQAGHSSSCHWVATPTSGPGEALGDPSAASLSVPASYSPLPAYPCPGHRHQTLL